MAVPSRTKTQINKDGPGLPAGPLVCEWHHNPDVGGGRLPQLLCNKLWCIKTTGVVTLGKSCPTLWKVFGILA